ncbi:MAG: MFS transporter [Solirubrobacteraceae bacterium]
MQSCLGTGAGYVALLWLTYHHLHTSWAISGVLLADFLPGIALGAVFGAFADRYSRRTLIVTANLLQAGAYGGLALSHTAVPIFALALLAGVGNAMQTPAMRSALPLIAGEASQGATALYDACRWVGITIGPLLAAGLLEISGVALPLALNGLSFLVAAAVMATVATARPSAATEGEAGGSGLRAGLAVAFAVPGIGAVIACSAGSVIAGGLLNVCEPILAINVLHGKASGYALLVACYGVGMVLASVFVLRRGSKPAGVLIRRYLYALALTVAGMSVSAIVGSIWPAALSFAATGYANSLLLVSETQLIQLRVPSAVQGRLFGGKNTVESASIVIGLVGAGALEATVGVRLTLATGAAICSVCAVAALVALASQARGSTPLTKGAPAAS